MTNEEKRVRDKLYRDNMSPEMKARVKESKRLGAIKRKDKAKVERAEYYQQNKEVMDARTKEWQAKDRARKKKVVAQPLDTWTLKEIAVYLDMCVPQVRAIEKDANFHMPKPTMIRIDGIDLYDMPSIVDWVQSKREAIAQVAITGASRKNKRGITIAPHVMLLINWMQKSKHVTKYCNAQRFNLASNVLWSKYA
jgi:hypothetical protein